MNAGGFLSVTPSLPPVAGARPWDSTKDLRRRSQVAAQQRSPSPEDGGGDQFRKREGQVIYPPLPFSVGWHLVADAEGAQHRFAECP